MKILVALAGSVVTFFLFVYGFGKVVEVQTVSIVKEVDHMSERMLDRTAEREKERYLNESVKVFVKGRGSKECMKILDTEFLDNRVSECITDHYVDMPRREAKMLKKQIKAEHSL